WSSKVVAYSQGLDEIRTAAQEYGWQVDMAKVASIWRDGCIIRARLLQRIHDEYAANDLTTLLEAPSVKAELASSQASWRRVVARAAEAGVPGPGVSAALSYYDQVRAPRLNAALTQGLRDLFGAHTYRRVDDQGSWHLQWSGDGSEVSA
ncbi:MAG: NADP-dependent phosphogluconate dehydrogenase, partial [Acidipropionibacterium jensenii]|nr:NADP-dependent phosphogluconate dehydrogenase [Acidipropionibacterium jensenii]